MVNDPYDGFLLQSLVDCIEQGTYPPQSYWYDFLECQPLTLVISDRHQIREYDDGVEVTLFEYHTGWLFQNVYILTDEDGRFVETSYPRSDATRAKEVFMADPIGSPRASDRLWQGAVRQAWHWHRSEVVIQDHFDFERRKARPPKVEVTTLYRPKEKPRDEQTVARAMIRLVFPYKEKQTAIRVEWDNHREAAFRLESCFLARLPGDHDFTYYPYTDCGWCWAEDGLYMIKTPKTGHRGERVLTIANGWEWWKGETHKAAEKYLKFNRIYAYDRPVRLRKREINRRCKARKAEIARQRHWIEEINKLPLICVLED